MQAEYTTLSVGDVQPNPTQHRKAFDPTALQELAASIGEHGLLEPILVRSLNSGGPPYQIIAGERRWRACKLAGLTELPARVMDCDELTGRVLALTENIERDQVSPFEEADEYALLRDEYGMAVGELAARFSKSEDHIRKRLALCACSQETRRLAAMTPPLLNLGDAAVLGRIADSEEQNRLAVKVAANGLSTTEIRRAVEILEGKGQAAGEQEVLLDAPRLTPEETEARTKAQKTLETCARLIGECTDHKTLGLLTKALAGMSERDLALVRETVKGLTKIEKALQEGVSETDLRTLLR